MPLPCLPSCWRGPWMENCSFSAPAMELLSPDPWIWSHLKPESDLTWPLNLISPDAWIWYHLTPESDLTWPLNLILHDPWIWSHLILNLISPDPENDLTGLLNLISPDPWSWSHLTPESDLTWPLNLIWPWIWYHLTPESGLTWSLNLISPDPWIWFHLTPESYLTLNLISPDPWIWSHLTLNLISPDSWILSDPESDLTWPLNLISPDPWIWSHLTIFTAQRLPVFIFLKSNLMNSDPWELGSQYMHLIISVQDFSVLALDHNIVATAVASVTHTHTYCTFKHIIQIRISICPVQTVLYSIPGVFNGKIE